MIEEILWTINISLCIFIALIWMTREFYKDYHKIGSMGVLDIMVTLVFLLIMFLFFIIPPAIFLIGSVLILMMLSVPTNLALGTIDSVGFVFTVYLLDRWGVKTMIQTWYWRNVKTKWDKIRAWYWRNNRKRELAELQRRQLEEMERRRRQQQEEAEEYLRLRLKEAKEAERRRKQEKKRKFRAGLLSFSSCLIFYRRLNSTRTQRAGLCHLHINQIKLNMTQRQMSSIPALDLKQNRRRKCLLRFIKRRYATMSRGQVRVMFSVEIVER